MVSFSNRSNQVPADQAQVDPPVLNEETKQSPVGLRKSMTMKSLKVTEKLEMVQPGESNQ